MSQGVVRVLVVDDEQSMQEFLEIFLRREGYDVLTAGDVDTALAVLEGDEIDLVLTDMQMPGKTGLDLILSAREVSPETVVIVITAARCSLIGIAILATCLPCVPSLCVWPCVCLILPSSPSLPLWLLLVLHRVGHH